jgi:hypothetical protein
MKFVQGPNGADEFIRGFWKRDFRPSSFITRVTAVCGWRWRSAVIGTEGVGLGAEAARRLARIGPYEFEPGLTDAEFTRIEREYGFWRDLLLPPGPRPGDGHSDGEVAAGMCG